MKHLKLFFALFAMLALGVGNAWAETYELVTSISDLEAGAKYIVGNSASTSSIFMSTATNTNNRKVTSALTITDNKVTITEDVLILELGGETGAWTFKTTNYLGTQGFLTSAASGKNNHCKVVATAESCSYFTIAFNDQEATITSTGRNERNILRYNSSNGGLFACYSSGQDPVYLYKLTTSSGGDEGGTEEPVLSATPTEIDFGTVYQGTTVEDKTVAVNFENLTGAVTYSGLSTPFTATGAISATGDKITISADASTIGERSQTLTIQSAADSKTAEVTVRINVEAPFNGKELGFDFVNHPTGWPIKSNATAGEYVYNLDDTDYTFKHSKSGDGVYVAGTSGTSGYLLIASGNTLGLPAIKGHKLVKVQGTLNNSGSPSTSASVSITDGTNTLSGGTAQTWNTKGGIYTYSLSGTQANTMYYLSVSNKNLQMITLVLYYEECEKYALTITEPAVGTGTLLVKDGENTLTSGAEIYEGTKLTVTATPAAGYEEGVVVVKNASDEDVTADVYDAGTLTMPAYAVTISATFEKKPCELLAKPTVSATTTYSSAKLTWEAVANAAKYSVKVGTADAVETTETSYEVTGLTAETTYTYQVQAIAEAGQDTYCDSEVAEGTFTTTAAPAATLKLKDIVGTTTLTGSLNGTITLPTEAAECSKTFVGWDADENCDHAPTYAPGAEYTLAAENQTLYAVYADGEGGGNFTITKTMSKIVSDNGYTVSSGNTATCYTSLTLDENITLSTTGSANCGSFWNDPREWRLYQNKSGNAIVTATNGCSLTSVKFTFTNSNTGTLLNNGASMTSGTAVSASGTSATYTVGNSGSATNGQIRITAIEVSYSKEGEYSNYSTTCAAAPKAEVNPTEVTATAAETTGKLTVTYDNVNTEDVKVALYNDAACTEGFTADWLTAALDGDKNITYTVAENTTYAERKAYIQLTAPDAAAAMVVIPVTQAAKDKVFASLEELVAADLTAGDEVTVTLNNDVIKEFYIYSSKRCGVVFDVQKDGKDIKIYFNSQTTIDDWAVGGKLSGTLTNVKWTTYSSAWQLAPANTWAWANLTYTEPKAVSTVVVSGAPTKTTYVDGEAFDPAGLTVTVNYNDATTEVNPTGVTFTVTPATLVKGQTSVSVTATYNSVTSAAYEVTDLTVNDIPTKTVAEFIAAGGTRCYLEGIVSGLTEGNSMKYGNFDLTDASGTIYVYGCLNASGEKEKFADLGVKNGDKIKVIADEYELYGGTKDEAKNVQYVSHVSAASITVENITMEVDEVATITATVDPVDAVVTYTIKENAANAISLSGNTITALAEGTATITATVAEGATYLGNSVDFTVTVGPKSEKVVILAEREGQWYALKAEYLSGKTDRLVAVPVDYFNGSLYNVEEEIKATIEWNSIVEGDKVSFLNDGKYLKGKTSTTLIFEAGEEGLYQWDKDTYTMTINGTVRSFLYNGEAFRNFAISNAGQTKDDITYSSFPVVTAPVYATGDIVYTRTVTPRNYGTICLPFGSTNYSGATFYEFVGSETGKVYLGSVTTLEAGVPYIFKATATELVVYSDGTTAATPDNHNGLYGTFTDGTEVVVGNYILKDNAICEVAATCWVNAYRAYIVMNEVPTGVPTQMPGRRYIGLDVHGENGTTGLDNIMTTDAPAKVIENGQLIIIRDGVKYNVQGQKL